AGAWERRRKLSNSRTPAVVGICSDHGSPGRLLFLREFSRISGHSRFNPIRNWRDHSASHAPARAARDQYCDHGNLLLLHHDRFVSLQHGLGRKRWTGPARRLRSAPSPAWAITSLSPARYFSARSSIRECHYLGDDGFRTFFIAVRGSLDGPFLPFSESAKWFPGDVRRPGPAGVSDATPRSHDCLLGAILSLEPTRDRPWSAHRYCRCLPRTRESPAPLWQATFRKSTCRAADIAGRIDPFFACFSRRSGAHSSGKPKPILNYIRSRPRACQP